MPNFCNIIKTKGACMFNLTSLKAFKIQNCPGSCKLIFFTLGPLTIRIKRETFEEMTKKMNDFLEKQGPKKIQKQELSLVK